MAKKWEKPKKTRFAATKLFLIVLVIACLIATVWIGYLLFTHQTNPIVGWIILLADIAVLFWNMSALRRYRVKLSSVFIISIVLVLLASTTGAFAGVVPFADAKDKVIRFFEGLGARTPGRQIAETVVRQLGPREYYRGYFPSGYETPNPMTGWKPRVGEWIYFFVEVKPLSVSAGKVYSTVLLSRNDYLYDSACVSWSKEDLIRPESAEPGERDVRRTREAAEKLAKWPPSRFVVLKAPYFDKEIEPLRLEFNSQNLEALSRHQAQDALYSKYVEWHDDSITGWKLGGTHLSGSEVQEICKKYVKVVVVDEIGLENLLEEK
jgi:hypothetical protein